MVSGCDAQPRTRTKEWDGVTESSMTCLYGLGIRSRARRVKDERRLVRLFVGRKFRTMGVLVTFDEWRRVRNDDPRQSGETLSKGNLGGECFSNWIDEQMRCAHAAQQFIRGLRGERRGQMERNVASDALVNPSSQVGV